jgi:hypothetical protein
MRILNVEVRRAMGELRILNVEVRRAILLTERLRQRLFLGGAIVPVE